MRMQTCCFSGHRTIRADQLDMVAARTERVIRELIETRGIRFFGTGGAIGYDYLCSRILFRLRKTDFPQIKVILTYPFEGYQDGWKQMQRDQYAQIWHQFDKRVCVSHVACREAFLDRNRHMVDRSLVACCTRERSGTGCTVRYAKSKGLTGFNIAE